MRKEDAKRKLHKIGIMSEKFEDTVLHIREFLEQNPEYTSSLSDININDDNVTLTWTNRDNCLCADISTGLHFEVYEVPTGNLKNSQEYIEISEEAYQNLSSTLQNYFEEKYYKNETQEPLNDFAYDS